MEQVWSWSAEDLAAMSARELMATLARVMARIVEITTPTAVLTPQVSAALLL